MRLLSWGLFAGFLVGTSAIQLIITELVETGCEVQYGCCPTDAIDVQSRGRYVELYSSDGAGQTIIEDLHLVRFTDESITPSTTRMVSLKGTTIGDDGFLIICADDSGWGGPNCDIKYGSQGSPADSDGDDSIAIIRGATPGTLVSTYTVVDIFGTPGSSALTSQGAETGNFRGRTAQRKSSSFAAKHVFRSDDWIVSQCTNSDPRQWSGAQPGCCLVATLTGDPHGKGAHGDKFSFRGSHEGVYNVLSAPNVSWNAQFEDTVFHSPWSRINVNGSFVRNAFWVLRTPETGRAITVAYRGRSPHFAVVRSPTNSMAQVTLKVRDATILPSPAAPCPNPPHPPHPLPPHHASLPYASSPSR